MSSLKIEIKNLTKYFYLKEFPKGLKVIDNLTLSVNEGEFISIIGPTGCGKTTLLNIISGVEEPTSGHVLVNGKPAKEQIGIIGYMLQREVFLPWRNVIGNILIGSEIRGDSPKKKLELARSYLEEYKLLGFEKEYPHHLSGGMRERIALIRTLINDPEVILFDEPFSDVDYETRLYLECDIADIIEKRGKTAIFVTHDIEEAISMGEKVVVLAKSPARIKAVFDVSFSITDRNPLSVRGTQEFAAIFSRIWSKFKEPI